MRKIKVYWLIIAGAWVHVAHAQVPKIGTDSTLDIANWNIEWFGDSINGPSNEATQLNNAVSVIKSMDMDIWGLCEISNLGYWQKLQNQLPDYGAVITNYSQTQKTALIYKKSEFKLLYIKSILTAYDYEFASGRYPLEVALEWDREATKDTLYFWVIHLKANTGTTSEKQSSYNRRLLAAEALKKYIDTKKQWKGMVLGDWNDDLDVSIFSSKESPFLAWRNDTNYLFPSYRLTLARAKSTASYSEMIDHQCLTPRLKWHWNRKSSGVMNGDAYIANYRFNTSDHYPVWSILSRRSSEPKPGLVSLIETAPVLQEHWFVSDGRIFNKDRIYPTSRARLLSLQGCFLGEFADGEIPSIPSGAYILEWGEGVNYRRTLVFF